MAAAAVLENRKIALYFLHGLTDFDQIWHGDAVRPLKLKQSKMESKNHYISATVGPIVTKFGTLPQFDLLDHSVSKTD